VNVISSWKIKATVKISVQLLLQCKYQVEVIIVVSYTGKSATEYVIDQFIIAEYTFQQFFPPDTINTPVILSEVRVFRRTAREFSCFRRESGSSQVI
jgi:hypothetical protein